MEGITAKRAVSSFEENEQAALEGRNLVSIETEENVGPEAGIYVYVYENFAQFLRYVRVLAPRDQEKLLAYYCLAMTQSQLAVVFRTTQTVCSFQLRASVRCMAALIGWESQNPTPDIMEPLLTKVGFGTVDGHSLAEVIAEYVESRSFVAVAYKYGIHRPLIRRTISNASKTMIEETQPPEVQACGWWLFKLIDRANPLGKGLKARAKLKDSDVEVTLPDICGRNRVSTDDLYIDVFWQSRANF